MERLKCHIRAVRDDDRGMLTLLAGETLQPLASQAGHPERYRPGELLVLLERADVFVAEADVDTGAGPAGFLAVEDAGDDLAVRCLCVHPIYEARGVANQLLDWAEGLALERGRRRLTAYVPAARPAFPAPVPPARVHVAAGGRRRDAGAAEAPAGGGGLSGARRARRAPLSHSQRRGAVPLAAETGAGRSAAAPRPRGDGDARREDGALQARRGPQGARTPGSRLHVVAGRVPGA